MAKTTTNILLIFNCKILEHILIDINSQRRDGFMGKLREAQTASERRLSPAPAQL